jgi:leader peptidase (prepilin peptidase)/N-methyltransferase
MLGRITATSGPYPQFWIIGAAIAGVTTSAWAAPDGRGVVGAMLALLMLSIAVCDARHGIIPNEFNVAGFALAMCHAVVATQEFAIPEMIAAALRGGLLGLSFLGLHLTYRWLRGYDGIGLGDVKLAVVAGAFLDWLTIPIVLEVAALAGIAAYVLQQFRLNQALQTSAKLPFGLYFAPAIWLGWLIDTIGLVPL